MTYHENAGKGSFRRERDKSVTTKEQFESNWDRIFGKKTVKIDPEQVEAKESVCKACEGKGGCMDAGWYYECPECGK